MKNQYGFILPPEMDYYISTGKTEKQKDWNQIAAEYIRIMKRIVRKSGKNTEMDMSDLILRRRKKTVIQYTDKIIERYKDIPGFGYEHRNHTGTVWMELNFTPTATYNIQETRHYLLFAASIWILDQIMEDPDKRKQLYRILPENMDQIDGLWYIPESWHAQYDEDLILSVLYILYYRNSDIAPLEKDSELIDRIIIDSTIAEGKQQAEVPSRKAYEALMALIPEQSIRRAAAAFEDFFWKWTDRYFLCVSSFEQSRQKNIQTYDSLVDRFNQIRKELSEILEKMENSRKVMNRNTGKKKPVFNPLLVHPFQNQMNPLMPAASSFSSFSPLRPSESDPESVMRRGSDLIEHMEHLSERCRKLEEKIHNNDITEIKFRMDLLQMGYLPYEECREQYGEEAAEHMKPIPVQNPYEICFALLWLIENDSDLPWLYGCGCGMMEEVIESLPWGVFEYDATEDPAWKAQQEDEEQGVQLSFAEVDALPKKKKNRPAWMDSWYERKYTPKGEELREFNRSMAQILYEETGCIMPWDMERYESRQKSMREYGLAPKDASMMLLLMTALSSMKRTYKALNFDEEMMRYLNEEEEDGEEEALRDGAEAETDGEADASGEKIAEELKRIRGENKRLKTALHESEKAFRENRKELAETKKSAEIEHRELADLREYVFQLENMEEDAGEKEVDESVFPYDVMKETVVFGGHETWLKAIRPMFTGKIRFIDKDLNFSVNVIRNAEIVWVQVNAISHSAYYRIIETVRQYGKPIRYFTCASAGRGALQLVEEDRK